jgi:hypothetical protein
MFRTAILAVIAMALPIVGAIPASAASYAEQFVGGRAIGATEVGSILNGMSDIRANRLLRSCSNLVGVSTTTFDFCQLFKDEFDSNE